MIITAATNDAVIPRVHPTTVVRLIGDNSKQADAIANWTTSHGKIGLLYQPSIYGDQLSALVAAKVNRAN